MFRIGKIDESDNIVHSISSPLTSLYISSISSCDMMSKNHCNIIEDDFSQETSVFGNFDPDDADFCAFRPGVNGVNENNAYNKTTSLPTRSSGTSYSTNTTPARPGSRHPLGRNSSTNSLKRTKSTNTIGGSRFYIGMF